LDQELARFPKAEVIWCQEEPKNMGAWWHVMPRLEDVLEKLKNKIKRPRYVGRPESASTAVGSMAKHQKEQAALVAEALGL
jgi:2-oxoglutarate dehydrogenase E1 component